LLNRNRRIHDYFKGKVVWITGASSGIGRGLALECAKAGARLIISARRKAPLDELSEQLRGLPNRPQVAVIQLDITDHTSIAKKTEEAASIYGRIDMLINNAGISQRSLIKDLSYEVVDTVVRTDLLGVIDLTLAVLKYMYKAECGHIVVTSSVMGKINTPFRSAYCAAKFGLHGFFSCLLAESANENIDVTVLVPGRVKTEISKNALNGKGIPQGFSDSGISEGVRVEKISPFILDAIAKRKFEYYFALTPLLRLGLFLNKFAPGVYRALVSKVRVT